MAQVQPVQKGTTPSLLEASKANELISAINALLRMKAHFPLRFKAYSDFSGSDLELDIEGLQELIGGGGGVPAGFIEEELDIVEAGNTAGTRYFLTKQ